MLRAVHDDTGGGAGDAMWVLVGERRPSSVFCAKFKGGLLYFWLPFCARNGWGGYAAWDFVLRAYRPHNTCVLFYLGVVCDGSRWGGQPFVIFQV